MRNFIQPVFIASLTLLLMFPAFFSCQDPTPPKQKEIVKEAELLNPRTLDIIRSALEYALENSGKVDDSIRLTETPYVRDAYNSLMSARIWSNEKEWLRQGDSLYYFIEQSERYGLFPSDYHIRNLRSLRLALTDSANQIDAATWARAELLMTDAFIHIGRHLKLGRLERDSVSLRTDTLYDAPFIGSLISQLRAGKSVRGILEYLEPQHPDYIALKAALPAFLDSMDRTPYTWIDFPKTDSLTFIRQLQSRLFESSYIVFNTRIADSTELSEAVKRAQESLNLEVDGKAGPILVRTLNNTGREKFKRIAINLDRYKQLPDLMPERYLWVNIPAFKMKVYDSGKVIVESKVIVGQPKTRTPVLTSEITNFITYPQWTVPFSIIIKEMLPKIQKNIEYLDKENLMVVDKYDSVIDPYTIDWTKLNKKYFPYLLRQREGDDNSLGVIKFNFRNKYSVYLHDTNARGLFSRTNRAMSHGCVRVQEWNKLARFLVSQDSVKYHPDTLAAWIKRSEKHSVPVRLKTHVFIRYFTSDVTDKGILLYEDIYEEDKLLRNRYFAKRA